MRKAYIVQFAPSGAEVIRAEPGGPPIRIRADDAARQYEILRAGARSRLRRRARRFARRRPPRPVGLTRPPGGAVLDHDACAADTVPLLCVVPPTPMNVTHLEGGGARRVLVPLAESEVKVVLAE